MSVPITQLGEQRSAIGEKGELWLASRLPEGWFWQPPRKDFGKDGLIVIRDGSELHNLEFSIQVKATRKPRLREGNVIIHDVSRSSVMYWMAGAYPTLIVAVDISRDCAYYAWHFELFDCVANVPNDGNNRISIRIPAKNSLTPAAWDDIRCELKRCYNYLYTSTSKGDSFVWIVASTGTVCNAARNLLKISESPVPGQNISEEEGITVLIEQQQHRNVLAVANKLLNGLSPESTLYCKLRAWIIRYEGIVRKAFPQLGDVPTTISNRFGLEVAFLAGALAASRRQMIYLIFDFVALITQIHPSGSHNSANNTPDGIRQPADGLPKPSV